MSRRQHIKLKYIAIFLWLLCFGNSIDLFFANYNYHHLKHIAGKVTEVKFKSFFTGSRRGQPTYFTKTIINIEGYSKDYFVIEKTNKDSLLMRIQIGDKVELYGRKWYQYLSYFELGANVFLVKKDGDIIYDITNKCRRNNMILAIACGIVGLIFILMYLDMAKNISIANWYQKKFEKKGISA